MTMGIQEFGDALIRTGDLDPVYVGLVKAELPPDQLARWLLVYWCYYHVGVASALSERTGPDFWHGMIVAARNELSPSAYCAGLPDTRWPRAAERRHFRGQKCVDAVYWLKNANPAPETFVEFLATAETEKQVMSIVQGWPMFGPWIAFKAADMMERVWGSPITFDRNLGLMYESPRAALDLLVEQGGTWGALTYVPRGSDVETWYNNLLTYFSARRAPPRGNRPCGPQEVETVLCKWASARGGHYHVGKDIAEQRAALVGWGKTAERIWRAYPQPVAAQVFA